MQGEAILQTLAEVSVAFAGFTGVVVAFGRHPERAGSIQAHAFIAMLASSLQTLVWSVLPFLLHAMGLSERPLWRVASAFLLGGLLVGAQRDFHLARRAERTAWTPFDRVMRWVIPVFGFSAILGLALNLFGAIDRAFAPYLAALLFLLLFSSVMFVRLLVVSPDRT